MSSPSTSALAHGALPFRERSRVRAGNYAVDAVDTVFSHTVGLQVTNSSLTDIDRLDRLSADRHLQWLHLTSFLGAD